MKIQGGHNGFACTPGKPGYGIPVQSVIPAGYNVKDFLGLPKHHIQNIPRIFYKGDTKSGSKRWNGTDPPESLVKIGIVVGVTCIWGISPTLRVALARLEISRVLGAEVVLK